MLDLERLARVPLLPGSGWAPPPAGWLAERFRQLRDPRFPPQLPAKEIRPAGRFLLTGNPRIWYNKTGYICRF